MQLLLLLILLLLLLRLLLLLLILLLLLTCGREFSWDIVEPISFFVSTMFPIAFFYVWFAHNKEDFTLGGSNACIGRTCVRARVCVCVRIFLCDRARVRVYVRVYVFVCALAGTFGAVCDFRQPRQESTVCH